MAPIFDNSTPIPVTKTSSQTSAPASPARAAEPVKKAEPAKPKVAKTRTLPPLGMSVRFGAKKEIKKEPAVEQKPQVVEETPAYGNQPVNPAELNKAWEDFAKGQETFVKQTLTRSNPVLKDGTVVHFLVENSFQEDKVNDVKPVLMPYLRDRLNNQAITVVAEVSASLESTKAFTPKEKLERMMKDNPALVKLVKTLDLQMD